MKRIFLLSSVALMASAMSAQTTYNWFDKEDCDANGWLWFDTQAKIDKYCGSGKDAKIRLVDATYENAEFVYPETYGDPTAIGWNEAGVKGGEGAKTGAIILPESDFTYIWSTDANGGGILMQFPDLAKLDLFVSVEGDKGWLDDDKTIPGTNTDMYGSVYGGDGALEPKDCTCIDIWYNGWNGKTLSTKAQLEWTNIESHEAYGYNWDTDEYYTITLGQGQNKPVTAYFWNNNKTPWYIHGIRVYTYTDVAGVNDIAVEGLNVKVEGKTIVADSNATVSVYNATGALVAKGQGNVDGGALTPGLYIVKATSANATTLKKVIL